MLLNNSGKIFSQHVSYLKWMLKRRKYTGISEIIKKKEAEYGEHPNVIFYLAVRHNLCRTSPKKLVREIFAEIKPAPALWLKNHLVMIWQAHTS